MHWHLFLALFDALPEDTPIKQRMYYRGVNIGDIRDKNGKQRIRKNSSTKSGFHKENMNAFEIRECVRLGGERIGLTEKLSVQIDGDSGALEKEVSGLGDKVSGKSPGKSAETVETVSAVRFLD